MSQLFSFFRKAFSLIFALLFSAAGAVSSQPSVKTGELVFLREKEYPYSEGVAFNQGLSTDGTFFYGTGCIKYLNYNAVVKIDAAAGDVLQYNDMCLPADVTARGYSHLGDCACCDGKIYAACEAFFFRDPAVMVFDADSLQFMEYHVLPEEGQGNGHIPWVCVDGDTLYYTQARDVDEVRMLNLPDFSYKGAVKLDTTITKVTGGDILDGCLYLSSNSGSREKTTYRVDLSTGRTSAYIVRDMGNVLTEAEGLAIEKNDDAVLFHYLDVVQGAKTSIRTYVFNG